MASCVRRNAGISMNGIVRRWASLAVQCAFSAGKVDPQKRWVWEFPFWLGINDGFGNLAHRHYIEKALAAGFHVAGVDVGGSFGSPAAAEVCQEFYEQLISKHGLHRRARLLAHSHGGLLAYGWAFRHPECVGRIAGMCFSGVLFFFHQERDALEVIHLGGRIGLGVPGVELALAAAGMDDQDAPCLPKAREVRAGAGQDGGQDQPKTAQAADAEPFPAGDETKQRPGLLPRRFEHNRPECGASSKQSRLRSADDLLLHPPIGQGSPEGLLRAM